MKINELLLEGEWLDLGNGPLSTKWSSRSNNLLTRSNRMLAQLIAAAGPKYAPVLKGTKVQIGQYNSRSSADMSARIVLLELTAFWDAPDDVLAFWIGHELGHIALHYKIKGDQWEKDPPRMQQQREFDADAFAIELAQKLGYSKSTAFRFIYHKKADLDQANQANYPSHPTPNQRIEQAPKGFYLSKGGLEQMDTLLTHLAE